MFKGRSMAKILIVEDELIPAYALSADLKDLGYQVSAITDTVESAVASAKQDPPNLAVVDISLRGEMNGVELAKELQNICDCPILFLTAYCDMDTISKAATALPYGYLTKPAHRDDLRANIAIALKRHQADRQLKAEIDREKEQMQLLTHFLDTIHHDVRTPLTTLLLAVDRIESSSTTQLLVEKIRRAATQVNQLLTQATNFQNGDLHNIAFVPREINLYQFCLSLIQEIEEITKHKCPIQLVGDRHNLNLKLDRNLLWQILVNLLTNAVKYSAPGSKVELEITLASQWVTLQVNDYGIGIPTESLPNIFLPHQRGSNVQGIAGDGMGLYAVKQAVDRHGGRINVISYEQKGTIFTVTLPVER
jgi:signal transduction histidine kinase